MRVRKEGRGRGKGKELQVWREAMASTRPQCARYPLEAFLARESFPLLSLILVTVFYSCKIKVGDETILVAENGSMFTCNGDFR